MSLSGKGRQRSMSDMETGPRAEVTASKPVAPSAHQTASYIAEICAELVIIAKAADLIFLAHLLTMAQAEGEAVSDKDI